MIRSELFLLTVISFFTGCRSIENTRTTLIQKERQDPCIQIGNGLLKSIQEDSYESFAKTLAGRTALNITRKDFDTSCRNIKNKMGKMSGYKFLTELKTPLVRNMVWVVSFENKTKAGTADTEMLFRLVTGTTDGKTTVLGLGFF